MKLKEIMDKYADYEVIEEELAKVLKKPKPKTIWELEKGDEYWCIDSFGDIYNINWYNDGVEIHKREIGRAFLTKQDAEFEHELRKIEVIMLKYGRRTFSHDCSNYMIRMEVDNSEISIPNCPYYNYGTIYFDTTELAQKAIEEIGKERLKKYYFRTEEQKK